MNKFTKRIAWTGKICMAMLCAFLVGSIASMVLAADPDSAGMTWEQFAGFFGWDPNDAAIALEDYDGDGLSNLSEWYQRTDPSRADTDGNGLPDGISPAISRARLDFHPLFTDGDALRYIWPSWMISVFKAGDGEWEPSLPAWSVPAGASGKLCLTVDRSLLPHDVVLELEFYDAPNASLFVDLVNNSGEVLISSEIVGNLMDGSGDIVRKVLNIPLESYPEAVGIHLRATGELFVLEGLLFVDFENDGLDENQEAILGTSDLMSDSDGDGISDYDEVFVYGTNPAKRGASPAAGRGEEPDGKPRSILGGATASGRAAAGRDALALPLHPTVDKISPPPFQATRIKSATIPQWVLARLAGAQSWMSGADFIMSRNALDGGGTRQTSPAFIMEDSLGQSSAIGFSYGSDITLHAGYQQAEAERLEIWNVSVTPSPYRQLQRRFNPTLGETATFSYVLSTPARTVTVNVYDQVGTLVRTLLAQQPQSNGLQTIAWDGKNNASNFVPVGTYQFYLSATNYEGVGTNYQTVNIDEIRMEVVENISVIQSVADQPDPFSPDITNSTISYVTAAPVGVTKLNLAIQIFSGNLSGLEVRRWDVNQPPGTNSVVWNGTDNIGINVPDGVYAYSVRDKAGWQQTRANMKSGAIMLLRTNTQSVASADLQVVVRYSGPATISITPASPVEASDALFAIKTAVPGQMLESMIYRIEATPPTTFVPPALMAFKYDQEKISGDIEQKLQIRRYNETNRVWEIVSVQFIDYANHQVLAEINSLSLYALLLGEDTTPPVIQIISPEAREYYQNAAIDIIYEVEDPVVGGISSGVTEVFVYLNGELYPYASIPPSAFRLGENVLMMVAYDGAGNIGRATVCFTVILEAQVTLKPEALNVNPGILTAFVRLPEGYNPVYITDATCDGAARESMRLNENGTEMIIKFRRRDIEEALAQIGESIDIYFVVRGDWQDEAGNSYVFQGADSITKIVGAK